jgi:small conductance mechanosensitive channel
MEEANDTGSEWGSAAVETVVEGVAEYGWQVIGAIIILLVGFYAAKVLSRLVDRFCGRTEKIDPVIRSVLVKITKVVVLGFTLYATLAAFGVETTGLVALIGAAGLTIGLALQGTLTNVAAGVMMMMLRPFSVGEIIVIGGNFYVVDEIGLFITRAHVPDGPFVILPNSQIWGTVITNLSRTHNDVRRVNETFGISYSDDIDKAIGVVQGIISSDERFLSDPAPMVAVGNLNDSSVDLLVHAWTKRPDWWATKLDLNKKIKQEFDKAGISIPFPQRDVHLYEEKGETRG